MLKKNKKPNIGDNVMIIKKPYEDLKYYSGIVKDVLTKAKTHTRGHKVRLKNNIVGRVVFII